MIPEQEAKDKVERKYLETIEKQKIEHLKLPTSSTGLPFASKFRKHFKIKNKKKRKESEPKEILLTTPFNVEVPLKSTICYNCGKFIECNFTSKNSTKLKSCGDKIKIVIDKHHQHTEHRADKGSGIIFSNSDDFKNDIAEWTGTDARKEKK